METNELTGLEKIALITTGAAAAWKILLWQLGLTLNSTGPAWYGVDALAVARVGFALLGFAAFDLVLVALVMHAIAHGVAWHSLLAAVGAASVSGLIALEVAGVLQSLALHAAPAVTLLLFVLHLMFSRQQGRQAPQAPQASAMTEASLPQATTAISIINHTQSASISAPAALPETVAAFIAAHAALTPQLAAPQLAKQLATSADTVRRALERIEVLE